jgi:hypothetical protein
MNFSAIFQLMTSPFDQVDLRNSDQDARESLISPSTTHFLVKPYSELNLCGFLMLFSLLRNAKSYESNLDLSPTDIMECNLLDNKL